MMPPGGLLPVWRRWRSATWNTVAGAALQLGSAGLPESRYHRTQDAQALLSPEERSAAPGTSMTAPGKY